jgi:hypothetical protein
MKRDVPPKQTVMAGLDPAIHGKVRLIFDPYPDWDDPCDRPA